MREPYPFMKIGSPGVTSTRATPAIQAGRAPAAGAVCCSKAAAGEVAAGGAATHHMTAAIAPSHFRVCVLASDFRLASASDLHHPIRAALELVLDGHNLDAVTRCAQRADARIDEWRRRAVEGDEREHANLAGDT